MQQATHRERLSLPVSPRMNPVSDLQLLAAIEPTDADFLSCYFDLTAGETACFDWLEKTADAERAKLKGGTRIDFEQALDMVRSALGRAWERRTQQSRESTLAIFARGLAGGQSLTVMPLDVAVEPSLTFYRVPHLGPLATAGRGQLPFTLVLARNGGLQVLDVDGDEVTPKAWAAFRENPQHAAKSIVVPQRRFQVLRRALSGASQRPLVIAGDGPRLEEVTEALPARATGRLRDVCRLPASLDQAGVIQRVKQRLLQRRELGDHQLASRLVRAVRSKGLAVAGPVPCREALRTGVVEALVLRKSHSLPSMWRCEACHELAEEGRQAEQCGNCGAAQLSRWDPEAELVRLACQQDVAVVYSDADALSGIGDVGCLLREPVEEAILEVPQGAGDSLDLVA